MPISEADTRAKLIDPALHKCGWTEDLIRREETEKGIDIINGKPKRRRKGRTDYLLRIRVNVNSQPIAVALIEAKRSDDPPDRGIEQAKKYGRLNHVPFIYSSNGHLFVEYDNFNGKTSKPLPLIEFPNPNKLRQRYEKGIGLSLESEEIKPLLVQYNRGEACRRYYQDAAIRASLEKIAQGKKRMLLFLATGSGKTFIAVHLLKKITDAGQIRRALFLCDRDELRTQGLGAFQNIFGTNAASVTTSNPQKNARILIATYQTLNVSGEDEDAQFFLENYPENYFSHIIIDECHRSAWGKWSIVLKRNPEAVQVGLTATPRYWKGGDETERKQDKKITANNIEYFGEPVYEYSMSQGIEDGYLPACEIIRRDVDLDEKGISREDIEQKKLEDAITGQPLMTVETREHYEAPSFEKVIMLPDRVKIMCKDLFEMFLQTGGPHQKTVIFCVRDIHADRVATEMNNLYADWCTKKGQNRLEYYAFKCTASVGGSEFIADLRGSERTHFIATTVDLITTGVDVPIIRNVVFFKYVQSPIAFQQMMGRGSRIHLPTNKLMFRVYDYTNATRLLGKEINIKPTPPSPPSPPKPPEKIISVEGFDVHINTAGTFIVIEKEGKLSMVSVEEYKQILAEHLVKEVKTFEEFHKYWIDPQKRSELIDSLPNAGHGVRLLRELMKLKDFDIYDVFAEIAFGMAPKSRKVRVEALHYKHDEWFKNLPEKTVKTLFALAKQFEIGGIEELENPHIFNVRDVVNAGGLQSLKILGEPKDIIIQTKERIFAL